MYDMTEYIIGVLKIGSSRSIHEIIQQQEQFYLKEDARIFIYKPLVNNNFGLLSVSGVKDKSICKNNIYLTYSGAVKDFLVPIPKEFSNDILLSIMHLYEEYGNNFAKYINGNFIIVIWHNDHNKLILIQDKFPGIKTFYWSLHAGLLIFSNYMKPIINIRQVPVQINQQGLYQYLKRAYIIAPNTIYHGIQQLRAGELLEVIEEKLDTYIYDPWEYGSERIKDEGFALKQYSDLLDNSIQAILSLDESCGFLLSGGLDSSVNVAIAAEKIRKPISTIGIGSNHYSTDEPFAKMVSDIYKTNHYNYNVEGDEINDLLTIIWQMENPYYDPGVILSCCALKLAKKHVNTVIGGKLADQIFSGLTTVSYKRFEMYNKYFVFV